MGHTPIIDFGGAHAFIWRDGVVTDLGTPLPGSITTQATGVNNFGHACGIDAAQVGPSEYATRSFYWSGGQMVDIGILPGFEQCIALDLNDLGQVVGYCDAYPVSGLHRAFVWQNGVMAALNDLVPAELNLDIRNVRAINNSGQIAGYALRPGPNGTDTVAVRLTPIPSAIGDFDGNCSINVDDLLGVINHWGKAGGGSPADFNADGSVGVDDLLTVLQNWG